MSACGNIGSMVTNLRLLKLNISGFKAIDSRLFIDVAPKMTLLVGMNGSGKSSILQAIGFARFFAEGRPQTFFDERQWDRQDVKFRSNPRGKATVIRVGALFDSPWGLIRWDFSWGLNRGKTYDERIRRRKTATSPTDQILKFSSKEGGSLGELDLPAFLIDGSILSVLPDIHELGEPAEIAAAVQRWGQGIRSLELLAPPYMRVSTRLSPADIGIKGDRLGGFLASLPAEQKSRVVQRLGRVYPIDQLSTVKKRAGWIDLRVAERYQSLSDISVAHMSDGFMRLLAICAIPELPESVSLVLLDEIEDGIEPHILARLIDLVRKESSAQIIATSHSPLLLNAIPVGDIRVVGRQNDGRSVVANAEDLNIFKEGSDYLGAGEQWVTVDLSDINSELQEFANKNPEGDQTEFEETTSTDVEP